MVVKNKFKFLKVYKRNNDKNSKKFEGFNTELELEKAQKTAEKLVTNNPYGIYDEYYDKYIKENMSTYFNSELEKDYLESPEFEDLKMFIKIAKELKCWCCNCKYSIEWIMGWIHRFQERKYKQI